MSPARRATLLLLSTTVIWGSTFAITKIAILSIPGTPRAATLLAMTLRFALAAIVFALVPGALKIGRREWWGSFAITLPGFIGLSLQGLGLVDGSSTIIAFLTNLMVAFTPVFGFLFFKEKLSKSLLFGAAMGLVGVYVLTNPAGGALGRPELYALLSSVIFGLQIQLVNHHTRNANAEAMTMGMFLHFTWMNALVLFLLPDGRALLTPAAFASRQLLWTIPYLAFVASALAMWVFMRFQREIPPTRAAIIYCLEPAFAAVFGYLLMNEALSWRLFAGGGLILAANLAVELLKPASLKAS